MVRTDRTATNPKTPSTSAEARDAAATSGAPGDEIRFLSAQELLRHSRAHTLSPVEVTRTVLAPVADGTPHINALYYIIDVRGPAEIRRDQRVIDVYLGAR